MEPGSLLGGKYRLRHVLGEGAMGVVWAATNEPTERVVALKVIPHAAVQTEELRMRLLREARACGRIAHRNVVQVYDVGESEGAPFLVMEMLTGETLASLLARRQRLTLPEAARIARDIARGLAAAHAAGIIHRDLKPANVFLHTEPDDDTFTVKVLDFGVSKALTPDQASVTSTGGAIGSPAYMSPEQARGFSRIDPRSDLWALGVVLFEMLAGRLPFTGDTPYEVVAEILKGPIPRLSDAMLSVDPAMSELVASCLQRDVEQRINGANVFLAALPVLTSPGVTEPTFTQLATSASVSAPAAAETVDSSLLKTATSTTPLLRQWDEVTTPKARISRRNRSIGLAAGAALLIVVGVFALTRAPTPEPAAASATPSASEAPRVPTPSVASTPSVAPTPNVAASATLFPSPPTATNATPKVTKKPTTAPKPTAPKPTAPKPTAPKPTAPTPTATAPKESPFTSPG